jgi:hypothetical protein
MLDSIKNLFTKTKDKYEKDRKKQDDEKKQKLKENLDSNNEQIKAQKENLDSITKEKNELEKIVKIETDHLRQSAKELQDMMNQNSSAFEVTSIFVGLAKLTATILSETNQHIIRKYALEPNDLKLDKTEELIKTKMTEINDMEIKNTEILKTFEEMNVSEEKRGITLTLLGTISEHLDEMKTNNEWGLVDKLSSQYFDRGTAEQKELSFFIQEHYRGKNDTFEKLEEAISKITPIDPLIAQELAEGITDIPELTEEQQEAKYGRLVSDVREHKQQHRQRQR